MKRAADFRAIARNSLKNNWGNALAAGLVASLLGAIAGGPQAAAGFGSNLGSLTGSLGGLQGSMSSEESMAAIGITVLVLLLVGLIVTVVSIAFFVLGSLVGVGYASFNLNLVSGQCCSLNVLFAYFRHWKHVVLASFLKSLYIFLWSLLLIVPGILASYSYAMTNYILAENPEIAASEALNRSKEMMKGNRWRLFCLEISFIGWGILAALTCGIGTLWLTPYIQAAEAAFYQDLTAVQ